MEELIKKIEGVAPLLGRFLLAAIFLWSGFHKITGWEMTAGYMAAKHMPLVPFLLPMAILLELGGGLALLFGFKGRLAALALVVFLVPTTLVFHRYWTYPPEEQMMQMINFLKNSAIIGGLLMATRFGAGEFSVDSLLARKKTAVKAEAPRLSKAA